MTGVSNGGSVRRVAYADPPYPGQSRKHYGDHPDYAGEVDHEELISRLEREYDAWVLHTGATQLQQVLALCPDDVRLLAWVKGWASFKHGAEIKYAWEPVIVRNPDGRGRKLPIVRDWFMHNVVTNGFVGAKPEPVCCWIFDCMGLEPNDELHDLFPGSGAVGRAWEKWCSQTTIFQEIA